MLDFPKNNSFYRKHFPEVINKILNSNLVNRVVGVGRMLFDELGTRVM